MKRSSPIYRRKLSKKFFMELPTGLFIVSNCYEMIGPRIYTPAFCGCVAPPEMREAQWEQIRNSGADQRMCKVYPSSEEYKKERELLTDSQEKPLRFVLFEPEEG